MMEYKIIESIRLYSTKHDYIKYLGLSEKVQLELNFGWETAGGPFTRVENNIMYYCQALIRKGKNDD